MCEVGYVQQYNVPPLSFHVTLTTWYQSLGFNPVLHTRYSLNFFFFFFSSCFVVIHDRAHPEGLILLHLEEVSYWASCPCPACGGDDITVFSGIAVIAMWGSVRSGFDVIVAHGGPLVSSVQSGGW
jgi:hypothetical protein